MTKILFGADPECCSVYEKEGKYYALPPYIFREQLNVPVIDDRNPRHPVFLQNSDWKVHEDGANWEFAVKPSHNPLELFQTIQDARKAAEEILSNFTEFCDGKLHFIPAVNWEVGRWANMPEDFFMSTEFGCDPDEDVLNTKAKCKVIDASLHPWRYCGGHIHVSGSPRILEDYHLAVKCMIITAGIAATAFSTFPGLEYERTYLYGKPGKFRVQNYGEDNPYGKDYQFGIEYRTPSATWAGNWEVAQKVLHWSEIGIKGLFETSLGEELVSEILNPAVDAILTVNQPKALELLSHVESKL